MRGNGVYGHIFRISIIVLDIEWNILLDNHLPAAMTLDTLRIPLYDTCFVSKTIWLRQEASKLPRGQLRCTFTLPRFGSPVKPHRTDGAETRLASAAGHIGQGVNLRRSSVWGVESCHEGFQAGDVARADTEVDLDNRPDEEENAR